MALTNAQLQEILSEAGVDSAHMRTAATAILERHGLSLEAIKEERDTAIKARDDALKERDTYKADAEKLTEVRKELETVKGGDWENKYKTLVAETAAKEARAAKSAALESYFKAKGIDGGNLKIAMLSAAALTDALELKKDGAIKDTAALDALVSCDLAPLVSHIETVPAHNPPASGGAVMPSGDGMTIDDIYKIEDATERQKAINEHPALFGYSSP